MTRPPLVRANDDRFLAGVCAGLAAHLGVPVTAVRVTMVALTVMGGAGALLYAWLWATVPKAGESEPVVPLRRALTKPGAQALAADTAVPDRGSTSRPAPAASVPATTPTTPFAPQAQPAAPQPADTQPATPSQPAARERRWPIAELLLGGCLLVAGIGFVLVRLGVQVNLEVLLPTMAVLVGVGLTWWQIADRDRPDRNQVPRVLGAVALVAAGVLMFFITSREPNAWTVITAAFAVLAGVALAIAPWLLRVNRELIAERAARAREAERSDIAAHLHDSVLQTLALIQQRSAPGSEVARLARGQERELREWLFRTADGAPPREREAAAEELRAHAVALEDHHAVRFEVVEVGAAGVAPEAIIAAAREAMLNAARHAGGDVTVYLESNGERVSIDVTDRGPGLDPSELPADRMGVRESILGRMERAGGTARIVPGPGGGTSVRLAMPRAASGDTGAAQQTTAQEEPR
ncbi:ATP-binding protein [Leucobacter chromiireducens]|uniref:ATP-binding protein n=1 Tax=Leucobacter chromiireducens TaxID=283877 RepID=UPI000F63DD31|nr:ATP-binding protein [Leucobacter chromiireducens]